MAQCSDAAMVLFYDIDGETSDHDYWHSYEHFHERLSVPGFLRATRWIATKGAPRYLVTYEVTDVDVARSQPYLDRLNAPSDWTSEMMPRFRGMVRGFCRVAASAGFGLGRSVAALRFTPEDGREQAVIDWLGGQMAPFLASQRGAVSAQLLRPEPPPPMTREQALRGADQAMPWVFLLHGYDPDTLDLLRKTYLGAQHLKEHGIKDVTVGRYTFHSTASAQEVRRTEKPRALSQAERNSGGPDLDQ
ncbi:hypothetical protein [Actibacterium pelagium]|uniref:Uncharacterized protein n=1 Tax=Actibacterium pelagium TaxID=2029103 RepID=A0A917AJT7_9RHOB|nr:hypothetical protein [Actibacterium pelagium]GGE58287.1 hypothetical protein GCM10011517_27480 [Actibacterium pelagium]